MFPTYLQIAKRKCIYIKACTHIIYTYIYTYIYSFSGSSDSKESLCNAGDPGLIPGSGKITWRSKWQPTPVFLPGEFHGQRRLAGYSPWGRKRVGYDLATNALHVHDFSSSPISLKRNSFMKIISFSFNGFLPLNS